MLAKQAINDKLQGNVATYLRCGRVVKNQIKKSLLLSLSVKIIKIGEYVASYKQECDCLMHFAKRRKKCATPDLLGGCPQYGA